MESERRRRILVNPALQVYLLMYAGIFALVFVGAVTIADVYFESSMSQLLATLEKTDQNAAVMESVERLRRLKTTIVIAVSASFLLVWMIQAYVMSTRVAGPIYKTCKYLLEVARTGKKNKLTFRQNDFYHELADAVNKALPPD